MREKSPWLLHHPTCRLERVHIPAPVSAACLGIRDTMVCTSAVCIACLKQCIVTNHNYDVLPIIKETLPSEAPLQPVLESLSCSGVIISIIRITLIVNTYMPDPPECSNRCSDDIILVLTNWFIIQFITGSRILQTMASCYSTSVLHCWALLDPYHDCSCSMCCHGRSATVLPDHLLVNGSWGHQPLHGSGVGAGLNYA